jgi:hypothetical protein
MSCGWSVRQGLFAEGYLEAIAQTSDERNIETLATILREWRDGADYSTAIGRTSSLVAPVLSTLDLQHTTSDDDSVLVLSTLDSDRPVGICLVVGPETTLDAATWGDHPAGWLLSLLRGRGLRWGILTDGDRWRLYCSQGPTPYESYVEVDLTVALQPAALDLSAVRLFAALFGREGFGPGQNCPQALDALLENSDEYVDALTSHLRGQVENVLGSLCLGFVSSAGKRFFRRE